MADNASITILRNTQANINAEPIKDGNILFTTDQDNNVIYADVGTKRIKIGGTVPIDSTITANSTNPVTSKAIYDEFNNVQRQICTNLLNSIAPTQTINGVTFTRNGDGTYTVNGTASYIIYYRLANQFTNLDLSREYKIVGCPHGGSTSTYSLYDDSNNTTSNDVGNGVVYTPTKQPRLYIRISNGTTVNNLTFKPMLTTDLSATYDDFVPYTGGSGRLNEDVANLFDVIRPVGSLYPTTDVNFDPNTATGWHGTWERIKDCVIYAAGTSDTIGSIVGSNTHKLTEAELLSHRHSTPQLTATGGKHRHLRSTGSSSYLYATTPASGTAGGTAVSGGSGTVNWNSGAYTEYADNLSVTVPASNTGYTGSGTAIDMRPRRLNSIVWRRIS